MGRIRNDSVKQIARREKERSRFLTRQNAAAFGMTMRERSRFLTPPKCGGFGMTA
jgi:hypothetical protein